MATRNTGTYPTQAELRSALDYNPDTGIFTWRQGRLRAGMVAGCVNTVGYLMIGIGTEVFNAHLLAWIYIHGEQLPDGMTVDHANGVTTDNRIKNLRAATWGQQRANQKRRKDARFPKGVEKRTGGRPGYVARIKVNKKRIFLGSFTTPEAAHEAYVAAAQKYHGEFARAE